MLSIRKTQIYGWLFPVVLEQIAIPGDAPVEAPPDVATAGSSEKEQREKEAKVYFEKAIEQEKAGELRRARTLYEKASEVGETTYKERAEAKMVELDEKCKNEPPKIVLPTPSSK